MKINRPQILNDQMITGKSQYINLLSNPSMKVKQYGHQPLPLVETQQKLQNRSQQLPTDSVSRFLNLSLELKTSQKKFEKLRMSPRNYKQIQKLDVADIFGINKEISSESDVEKLIQDDKYTSSFSFTFKNMIGNDMFDESFIQ